jgi:hypothetical protein
MTKATIVPVTLTPEATARVAELGMRSQLDQMLEHTRQSIPDLLSIEVKLDEPYNPGDTPRVIIEARRAGRLLLPDRTEWDWGGWKVSTFPPEVAEQFLMITGHEIP